MERIRIERSEHTIQTVDDWKAYAGPKSPDQWKPERSAYELARAWCEPDGPHIPDQLRQLLDSRPETRGARFDVAMPEHRIRFDRHGGEPRNADMALVGRTDAGKIAITIEAKADEPFGATVAETFSDALERLIENPRSRGVRRIEDLARALFGVSPKQQPRIGSLRYQLLTAVAGTVAYAVAEVADVAVLVIHEFKTSMTDDALHEANNRDLEKYLRRLSGAQASTAPRDDSQLFVGPLQLPGAPLFVQPPPLLIGRIVTDRR